MKKITCDICGEEIGEVEDIRNVEKHGYLGDQYISISLETDNELCKKCILEIFIGKIDLESDRVQGEREERF